MVIAMEGEEAHTDTHERAVLHSAMTTTEAQLVGDVCSHLRPSKSETSFYAEGGREERGGRGKREGKEGKEGKRGGRGEGGERGGGGGGGGTASVQCTLTVPPRQQAPPTHIRWD